MPVITAVALERLIEANSRHGSSPPWKRSTYAPSLPAPTRSSLEDHHNSPMSDFSSPYGVNRYLGLLGRFGASEIHQKTNLGSGAADSIPSDRTFDEGEGATSLDYQLNGEHWFDGRVSESLGDEDEDDGFLDTRDSLSVASGSEAEDVGSSVPCTNSMPSSNHTDFYDAEDSFSDGPVCEPSPSPRSNFEFELCSLRLSLFEEIQKRKGAEEALLHMRNQWKNLASSFTQLGLSFPDIQNERNLHIQIDPEAICQEIEVARLVSGAVEGGVVRAEIEAGAEAAIDLKNREISRLQNRLQYYEAVNHEMFQRNQEAKELARQKCLTKRRLIWGCILWSVTVGASLLAYSCIPDARKDLFPDCRPDGSYFGDGVAQGESSLPSD